MMNPQRISLSLGTVSLALILGALAFQYVGHIAPCELCHWQRWPHIAAAIVGLGGAALTASGVIDEKRAPLIAGITIALITLAAALAVYHAGVEWKWWAGPAACTGERFEFKGLEGLNEPAVRCDQAAWRLFGISLAGYNALISIAAAAFGAMVLGRRRT